MLADASRVRLLALLVDEELTVAELSTITRLKQPRVSTHLARLKESGLVVDRRSGVAPLTIAPRLPTGRPQRERCGRASTSTHAMRFWRKTEARRQEVLAARSGNGNWADTVAGDMERHYSPGRTWEASMRACLELLELGDVLDVASGDGALAQLLAPRARTLTCVDLSERVVAAGRMRLADQPHARVVQGDMHELPLTDASVDLVLLLQALPFSEQPDRVLSEAARVLRPNGRLLLTCLDLHEHRSVVAPFGHRNLGFLPADLRRLLADAGFHDTRITSGGVEARPPHFQVWVATARR